ncbi:MAG: succinate dehydrogenase assembly factor 2 [Ketobacteraceae bacterium]|nr:succinate dehydrogenase assembly factor 2 [Ketobacteraceae bacterium]
MSPSGYSDNDLRRLSWQCRRGIKEVEVLLAPFFERHFGGLSARDQDLFVALLEESDVDLFEWFTTRAKPQDPELRHIVDVILARMAS